MKKFFNALSFVLVFAFMFCFSGCGEPIEDTSLTRSQVIEMVTELFDFESLNVTITADVEYDLASQKTGEAAGSLENSIEGLIFKCDGTNSYSYMPNVAESYLLNGYRYSRCYGETETEGVYSWSDFNVQNITSGSYDPISAITGSSDLIETFFGDFLNNIVTYDSDFLTSEKLDSGAYKLTLNADLTTKLTAYKNAIVSNVDKTIAELVDAILAVDFQDLTVTKIVSDIKTNITANSTLQDVLDFIDAEFGYKIQNLISNALFTSNFEESETFLSANFYELIDVQDSTAFATLIDGFVTNYLTNTSLTLSSLLASNDEEIDNSFLSFVRDGLAYLSNLTINTFVINATITTNSGNDAIESITASIDAEAVLLDTTYSLDASANFVITDVGSTIITSPNFTDNIGSASLHFIFAGTDLTASTAKVISNVNIGTETYSLNAYTEGLTDSDCVYNSTAKTITLSANAVNYLIENDVYLMFYANEGDIDIIIHYNVTE